MSSQSILAAPPTYRIQPRDGCTVIHGKLSVSQLQSLVKEAPGSHLMDAGVARLLGATAVIGPVEGLARIRAHEAQIAVSRVRAQLGNLARRLDVDAIQWLAVGEHCLASLALFTLLSGVRPPHHAADVLVLPSHAQELRQCRLLMEQVPSLARLLPVLAGRLHEAEVASWAAVAESWSDLCALMDHEAPEWRDGIAQCAAVDAMLSCFHQLAKQEPVAVSVRTPSLAAMRFGAPRTAHAPSMPGTLR